MIGKFISIIRSRQRRSRLGFAMRYIDCGRSEFAETFSLRVDYPKTDKKYLQVGDECIIGGNFIFESQEGVVTIGDGTYIGASSFICRSAINIGCNVTIAWGTTLYDHNSHSTDHIQRRNDQQLQLQNMRQGLPMTENKNWSTVDSRPITIGDDAWIGMNVLILKGVTIGQGAIVGAGSVVVKDVEPFTVVGGNPAVVIKRLR